MVLEVRMLRARDVDAQPMGDAPSRAIVREQHRTGPSAPQGAEEGSEPRGIVDEWNALFGEGGARQGRDLRHHRGSVPGRVLGRKSAHGGTLWGGRAAPPGGRPVVSGGGRFPPGPETPPPPP